MDTLKKDIKSLSFLELNSLFSALNEKPFRIKQLLKWLYCFRVNDFDSMTDLSKNLRNYLKKNFCISNIKLLDYFKSNDSSVKFIFKTNDDVVFEAVGIPNYKKNNSINSLTVCVSSQAGCKIKCSFCSTGKQKFYRSLNIGEIVDQVLNIQKFFKYKVSNVVVMGQGEPFLNYDNVVDGLKILNKYIANPIGARKITISTSGILNGIDKLSHEKEQFGIAVSLHSCIQNTRDLLMPGVKEFSLEKLHKAIECYIQKTNRRPTFEYLLLKKINDDKQHLEALIDYCRGLNVHVNLLPYNKTKDCEFIGSSPYTFNYWKNELLKSGIQTTIRKSRGSSVNAACGQLINQAL